MAIPSGLKEMMSPFVFNAARRPLGALMLLWPALLVAPALRAQGGPPTPAEQAAIDPAMEGVGVTQKLNATLPQDLRFVDDTGVGVTLRHYFQNGRRPVILTLNYYKCPLLCGLMLNGLLDALKQINLEPGRDFEVVTISFDPLEDWDLARAKKASYVREYGRSSAAAGWHFLVGERDAIRALTDAVGFSYKWNAETEQWMHPATLILCMPDGRVSRYLGGVMFDPRTLRLSLVEASQGHVGTLFDQVFLTCFHYVDDHGKYSANVRNLMRIGGLLTVLILAATIVSMRSSERRRRSLAAAHAEVSPGASGQIDRSPRG